jgi:exonuclease VII large subunit
MHQAPKLVSNAAEKQARIYQRKLEQGRRDITRILENRLRKSTTARVALIMGQQSVIENDIRSALDNTLLRYELHSFRVNLGTAEELIQQIEKIEHSSYDLIAVARGGGAGQEIFDDEELAYIVAGLQTPLVTAIGHADDRHLLDRIADKSFATPSQLGTFLKTVVTDLEKDISHSQPSGVNATNVSEQVQKLYGENKRLMEQLQQARAAQQAIQNTPSLVPYVILAIALGFGLGVYLV